MRAAPESSDVGSGFSRMCHTSFNATPTFSETRPIRRNPSNVVFEAGAERLEVFR